MNVNILCAIYRINDKVILTEQHTYKYCPTLSFTALIFHESVAWQKFTILCFHRIAFGCSFGNFTILFSHVSKIRKNFVP